MVTESSVWHEKCLIFIGVFHSTKNRIGGELNDEERYSYICLNWLWSLFFNFVRSGLYSFDFTLRPISWLWDRNGQLQCKYVIKLQLDSNEHCRLDHDYIGWHRQWELDGQLLGIS
jgi:hypothetical protein